MKDEKILKDEIMTEEELENVAGGNSYETMKDSQFLHALGLLDKEYSLDDIKYNQGEVQDNINSALNKIGMYVRADDRYRNLYIGMGAVNYEVGRAEAYKMICEKVNPGFDYKQFL